MSITADTTLLEAAHEYARRGWRVIPLHRVGGSLAMCSCRKGGQCASAGKHPKNDQWQNAPRMTGPEIQETWDVAAAPNLGIAVGRASGLFVLDIDPEHGGADSMTALVAEHGPLPATFVVQTGSGGWHYYFAYPDSIELRNTAGRIAPGIDTRAEGGQVVAAPSRSAKGSYVVLRDAPIAEAPQWLIEAARKPDVEPGTTATASSLPRPEDYSPEEWQRLNAYAAKAVQGNLERLDKMKAAATPDPSAYRGEPWNHTTFQVACSLIEIANSTWNEYTVERAYNDVFTRAPRDVEFDDFTVNKTFESARERIGDKARAIPEDRQRQDQQAVDAMFSGPDVIQDPSDADRKLASAPVSGIDPEVFFDKKDLLAASLAHAIMQRGPIAWGRDEAFWSFENGVWVSAPSIVEERCVEFLGERYRNGHASNVSTIVKAKVMRLDADPTPDLMNFRDTMINWRTGNPVAHDPLLKSTIQFPFDWDPDAACPAFDRFLADVMHEDYVDLAWEMIGYLMYAGNPLQVAFLLYGSGGNGKGTLMRVITDLLGHQNIASESLDDLNANRFSAVNLFGKIANLAGDIDGTYQESTANFKKLTGEDTYAGERKFGQRFTFQSWAVPVFSANKIPGSADVTEGYLRRWVVLHFHKRITNMIPGFSDLLSQELPGIAAKGVRALRVLMEREKFEPHGVAVAGKEEFALQIDQVRQWVASGNAILSPAQWTSTEELYSAYVGWSMRTGQGKLKEAEFAHRLESIGYGRAAFEGRWGHYGLTVGPQIQGHYNPSSGGYLFQAPSNEED